MINLNTTNTQKKNTRQKALCTHFFKNLLTYSTFDGCGEFPCCTFEGFCTVTATMGVPLAVCIRTGLLCLMPTFWLCKAAETCDSKVCCAWELVTPPWTLMFARAPARVEDTWGRIVVVIP